jgi:hypothetical protein
MAGKSNVTDATSFSIIGSLQTESVSSRLPGFAFAWARRGGHRATGASPAAVFAWKSGWGLAEFLQSIGAHMLTQSVISAESRGAPCAAPFSPPSPQSPSVVVETQTGTAVVHANEKRENNLTRILLVISSDQFEVVDHYQ